MNLLQLFVHITPQLRVGLGKGIATMMPDQALRLAEALTLKAMQAKAASRPVSDTLRTARPRRGAIR